MATKLRVEDRARTRAFATEAKKRIPIRIRSRPDEGIKATTRDDARSTRDDEHPIGSLDWTALRRSARRAAIARLKRMLSR